MHDMTSKKLFSRKVVHHILSESVQMKSIGGWSKILSEFVQLTFARAKTEIFCFRNDFIIHGKMHV